MAMLSAVYKQQVRASSLLAACLTYAPHDGSQGQTGQQQVGAGTTGPRLLLSDGGPATAGGRVGGRSLTTTAGRVGGAELGEGGRMGGS